MPARIVRKGFSGTGCEISTQGVELASGQTEAS